MTTPHDEWPVEAELQRRYAALVRGTSTGHPSEDDWVRFADGTLDDTSRLRLADHVTTCGACADVFRAVSQVRSGAPALAGKPSLPGTSRFAGVSRAWYGLALAATLVLAMVGAVRWSARGAAPTVSERVAVSAPGPASVSPATETPASIVAPGPRSWAALPVAPAITLPASLALVTRGASPDTDAFMTAFGAAVVPYRAGRYGAAAAALQDVARRHPDIAEGWFYLGAARLLAGDAAGALPPLERARASTVLAAEARWLTAIALERAGRGGEADAALSAMCANDPPNRDRACAATAAPR
ncbi:MAG: hypothetical protein IT181_18170 [Acidobacteria bacterium]|nr:hypothetical protein [Acidobacteriota bacterium]